MEIYGRMENGRALNKFIFSDETTLRAGLENIAKLLGMPFEIRRHYREGVALIIEAHPAKDPDLTKRFEEIAAKDPSGFDFPSQKWREPFVKRRRGS